MGNSSNQLTFSNPPIRFFRAIGGGSVSPWSRTRMLSSSCCSGEEPVSILTSKLPGTTDWSYRKTYQLLSFRHLATPRFPQHWKGPLGIINDGMTRWRLNGNKSRQRAIFFSKTKGIITNQRRQRHPLGRAAVNRLPRAFDGRVSSKLVVVARTEGRTLFAAREILKY